ncbi:MAG: hypothetical protein GQ542_08200 [Desulforhopalus sp.]|nr:hypothetical protein [Desulforhopalus sp.]
MVKYSDLRYGYLNVELSRLSNREHHLRPHPVFLKKDSTIPMMMAGRVMWNQRLMSIRCKTGEGKGMCEKMEKLD